MIDVVKSVNGNRDNKFGGLSGLRLYEVGLKGVICVMQCAVRMFSSSQKYFDIEFLLAMH